MASISLTTAIVSPDPGVHRQLQQALEAGSMTDAIWSLADYPELPALEQLKQAPSGCVLFLDFSDPVRARRIAAEIERAYPSVSVVAVYSSVTKEDVIALMQLGVREIVATPISSSEVAVAFVRASKRLKPADASGGNIYAFLPARAGAGATTIAISAASAVARISRQRTLLLDFDLRFGITSFLLKLDGRHCVQDALNQSRQLDEDLWMKLVTRRDTLEILGSAPVELPTEPRPEEYTAVLNCAQSRYAAIFVDLPGALERHEVEAIERAKEIFLVITGDVTGLHMAKRQAEALRRLQPGGKISALYSQADRRASLPLTEVEKLLQLPIRFTLPKDDQAVTSALLSGGAVQAESKFGAQIEMFAKSIAGTPVATPAPVSERRFLQFFSVSPARDRNRWGN